MADADVPGEGIVPSDLDTPDTGLFQIQYGPNGACRIVLIDEESPSGLPRIIGTLTLLPEDADELARMLEPGKRRQMWQQMADQVAKGAQH